MSSAVSAPMPGSPRRSERNSPVGRAANGSRPPASTYHRARALSRTAFVRKVPAVRMSASSSQVGRTARACGTIAPARRNEAMARSALRQVVRWVSSAPAIISNGSRAGPPRLRDRTRRQADRAPRAGTEPEIRRPAPDRHGKALNSTVRRPGPSGQAVEASRDCERGPSPPTEPLGARHPTSPRRRGAPLPRTGPATLCGQPRRVRGGPTASRFGWTGQPRPREAHLAHESLRLVAIHVLVSSETKVPGQCHRSETHANEPAHGASHRLEETPHLAIAAFAKDDVEPPVSCPLRPPAAARRTVLRHRSGQPLESAFRAPRGSEHPVSGPRTRARLRSLDA